MDNEDDIVTITLLEREMQFRRINPGQLLLMQRMQQRAKREADAVDDAQQLGATYKTLMIKVLDVIDTLFVSEADREDVELAVLKRQLDIQDLMIILYGGTRPQTETPDDADPVAAPKTLKAKKPAAVAKVAKKTASTRGRR